MENEVLKAELINQDDSVNTEIVKEISVIEESHKSAILSIHENMNRLVNDCLTIVVDEDDKQKYETAVELKKIVKATHVAIKKKKEEVKKPLIEYGKRFEKWVDEIYTPLVNAEKIVKKKMEIYEAKQEKLKQEKKVIEEQQKNEELQLEIRLKNLNSQLERINSAKNKAELKEIEIYLDSIVISEFGAKSGEAGFILNQLKLTCSMASRLMKDEEEKPVEAPKLETTPITDNFVKELKEMSNEPVKKVVIENELESGLFEKPTTNNYVSVISAGEFVKQEVPKIQEEKVEVNVISEQEDAKEEETKIEVKSEEKRKASDEEVISIIDHISIDALPFVNNLIMEKTNSLISNSEAFNELDFSEHRVLIISEVAKRIGVLLSK
jgi:hypothetical protein